MKNPTMTQVVGMIAIGMLTGAVIALVGNESAVATGKPYTTVCDHGNRVYLRGADGIDAVPRDPSCAATGPTTSPTSTTATTKPTTTTSTTRPTSSTSTSSSSSTTIIDPPVNP